MPLLFFHVVELIIVAARVVTKEEKNKAGYTAQDAPSMRAFHLQKKKHGTDGVTDGRTDLRTDTTSYRDATAHLKRKEFWFPDTLINGDEISLFLIYRSLPHKACF